MSDFIAPRERVSSIDILGLVACLVVAMGLRLSVILIQPEQLVLDRDVYLGIATSVADGRGFSTPDTTNPTAFRPPLYPLCLALGLFNFLPALVVAGVNLLSGGLAVLFTADIGKRLYLGRLRFVAAFLVAVDPLLLQYSSRPMTESFCTALAAFWLWSVIAAWPTPQHNSPMQGLTIGVSFGLLVLSRPTFWPVAGFCGLYWLIPMRPTTETSFCKRLWREVWPIAGTGIVVMPWMIRNWIVFGIPILMTTHGGYTLLLGNNLVFHDEVVRKPWGTTWSDESQRAWEADRLTRIKREIGPHLSEIQEDAWNSHCAIDFIKTNPGRFAECVVHRVRSLWNTIPQGDGARGVNKWMLMIVGWFYTITLSIGLLGLLRLLKRGNVGGWWPIYVLIVSVQLVHLFYWTNTRMRAPLTPAIALLAASALSRRPADPN